MDFQYMFLYHEPCAWTLPVVRDWITWGHSTFWKRSTILLTTQGNLGTRLPSVIRLPSVVNKILIIICLYIYPKPALDKSYLKGVKKFVKEYVILHQMFLLSWQNIQ